MRGPTVNYQQLLETILTHVQTIDGEIGKQDTTLIQNEVDTLWSIIAETQHQQWIESILELK